MSNYDSLTHYCLYYKYCIEHDCYCPLGNHTEINPKIVESLTKWTEEEQQELEEIERKLVYYDMLDEVEDNENDDNEDYEDEEN